MKSVEKKIYLGFFVISLIIHTLTVVSLVSMKLLLNRSSTDKRTLEILKTVESINLYSIDIETGVRGYLISGDTTFLGPYYEGLDSINYFLLNLKNIDKENQKYDHDLKYLTKHINDLISTSNKLIYAESINKTDTIERFNNILFAKKSMDRIRSIINVIEFENREILKSINSKNRKLAILTQYGFIITGVFTLIALLSVFLIIKGEFNRRKKVEARLLETQQFLDSILEYSPNIIYSKNRKGAYTFVNKSFEKLIGKSKYQIIGKTDIELFDKKESVLSLINNDAEVLNSKKPMVYEEQTKSHDGTVKYFLSTKFPILDTKSEVKFICGFSSDITDRVISESILKEKSERIYDLYNNAPCGYLSVKKGGLIIDINDTLLNWISYTREEVVNKMLFTDLITEDSVQSITVRIKTSNTNFGELTSPLDLKYITKKSGIFIGRTNSSFVFDENNEMINTRTVVLDITQLKEAENNIKKLNAELEAFSYSVSHDLRAPLRAIDGFAKILVEDYSEKIDHEGNRFLNIIIQNANKMSKLIDDLLDFSRIGRKDINRTKIVFKDLIQEVLLDSHIPQNVQININIANESVVYADRNMLKVIINNLLSNSIKYSSRIEKPIINIFDIKDKHNYIFCVEDNGVGFDEEFKNKLFEVFQRLHSDSEYEGTGVGLALVNRIIEKHEGSIWAESKPLSSTKFYVALPFNNNQTNNNQTKLN